MTPKQVNENLGAVVLNKRDGKYWTLLSAVRVKLEANEYRGRARTVTHAIIGARGETDTLSPKHLVLVRYKSCGT